MWGKHSIAAKNCSDRMSLFLISNRTRHLSCVLLSRKMKVSNQHSIHECFSISDANDNDISSKIVTSINLSDCSNNSNASSTTSVPFTNELNDVESYLESCADRETSQANTDSG